MAVRRMSMFRKPSYGAGHDEWGDPIPNAGVTIGRPDFKPVWESPEGEQVPIHYRTPRTRDAAIERVARQVARTRRELVTGWQMSAASGVSFLRYRGWRLLPEDGQTVMWEAE